jgi:hypothetical protein
MDKTTIVSLFPLAIDERKPGIYPGHFAIKPAKDGDFEILHVGNSVYWVNFYDDRPPIPVSTPANEIAISIINDFSKNLFGYDAGNEAWPGLFWLEGHLSKAEITSKHADKIAKAKAAQLRWYENLIKLADDAWVGSNKQHRAVSSLQRLACKALGLEREWVVEINTTVGPKYCPACKTRVHEEAAVCSNCRFILDDAKYKTMKFASPGA